MENRERDKMSRNTKSTSGGDVNRNPSSRIGKDKSDTSADFGQKVGQQDKLNDPKGRNGVGGSSGYGSSGDRNSSSGSRH
ncbi:MAG TPA: hypothetical protein VNN08_14075 [Thermoanaerobaculia bacterium]|nr:hypothetical protein [Thermoanaerobaculia bacterium]